MTATAKAAKQYKRLPGTARRYRDVKTGKIISRRKYTDLMKAGKVKITRKVSLKVYCYRDYLGGHRLSYFGVNLYFCHKGKWKYFRAVQRFFKRELEAQFGHGIEYEETGLSHGTCRPDRPDSGMQEHDFEFEISDLKNHSREYKGRWHDGKWQRPGPKIYTEFDLDALEEILLNRGK